MTRQKVVVGVVAAAVYLLAAGLTFSTHRLAGLPILDDGVPPPPYQWVKPPPDRVRDNKPPNGVTSSIPLTALGSAGSVATLDGRAQLLLDTNSIPPLPGQSSVSVTIAPLDPGTVGPPPAGGYRYDSNTYGFSASYEPSGQPVVTITATIVISFATTADRIVHWDGSGWDTLPTTPSGNNQLFVPVSALGLFAAVGRGTGKVPGPARPWLLVLEVAAPFAVIAASLLLLLGTRRRR